MLEEAPSHRLRDGRLSLREANSSPQARLPMTVHPPPAHTHIYVLWQVNSLVQPMRTTSWTRFDRQDGSQGAFCRCTLAVLAHLQPLSASLAAQVIIELAMAAILVQQAGVRGGYAAG